MSIRTFSLRDWFALGETNPDTEQKRLPRFSVWLVWLICLAPWCLNQFGVNFKTKALPYEPETFSANTPIDILYHTLAVSFTHTILEWRECQEFCVSRES